MLYNKRLVKFTARVLFVTMAYQLVLPAVSFALTSGPSQPEVQSFEPVGTTDMVDLFTGDFVYNIPLLDVEGYPVNIAYHSGSDLEQEASWVGLGWNINPGVINRSVRGLPDDFNGDIVSKTLNIKPERNVRVGLGVGAEAFGIGQPLLNLSADLSANLNVSNYRGVSADFTIGAGVNVLGTVSAGINMGVSSQNGADVDYNVGISFKSSQIISSDIAGELGLSMSQGYSTRTGVKDRNFSISSKGNAGGRDFTGPSFNPTVPIGLKNIVPVITNETNMSIFRGQIKLGGELFGAYGHVAVYGMISDLEFKSDGSRPGYGYLYADKGDDHSIQDFTRDKDGLFNASMHFLPPGNMTYDIYSVSGQGTGGSFRPFRNDLGTVYDPVVTSAGEEFKANFEAGLGELLEFGSDVTFSHTDISSGPWDEYKRPFTPKKPGSSYEDVYFKQAGEATAVNEAYLNAIQGTTPLKGTQSAGLPLTKPGSGAHRDPRANLIYYFTGQEAQEYGVASSRMIYSYNSTNGFASGADISRDSFARVGGNRKAGQISEIVQVQTDGRKYIYGLPAMNNTQEEATFAIEGTPTGQGMISYQAGDASTGNNKGMDHFFSSTVTPAYAHSYLLTSVLSADYTDISGDGPTDDDFGSFTKFNYTLKDAAYQWKAPYGSGTAQYNPGFKSDGRDDRASFLKGNREQWILHSIETKNFVAEFYTTARLDGKGEGMQGNSYKLDSIRLFNKHDRFINKTTAVPIKTVIFNYTYALCPGVPNTSGTSGNNGKLTLSKIFIRYGNSARSMISPYQFTYVNNYGYNRAAKDRWGVYKPNVASLPNWDFPFVKQTDANLDKYAAAWSLSEISLPSGGKIDIDYESDDYAYVQDKPVMEMFMLAGVGSSKNFVNSNQLYADKAHPYLYFYFARRIADERPGSFKDNYLKDQDVLYYNCDTRLVNNSYEPIKGYAQILDVGICDVNTNYGYVKVKPVTPQGGGASLNPAAYTAINFARYYLPQIVFPGNNPDNSDIQNVLSGLKYAFGELMSFGKNPVKRMVEEGKAKDVKLATSFIRLNSPGLKKKGGGSRVKRLAFYDNWSKLAGGNAEDASYGKDYGYTIDDPGGNSVISSGVASYEPQIGGDENPFRMPVNYSVQSGSNWPPNDPVGVYQDLPIGETLYPAPVVGYSRVTTKSIHQQEGRSSQGEDIYDFYTAKDFPVQALSTPLDELNNKTSYSFTSQKRIYQATQGYTLVFNDMHGKPKRTEHRIIKPSTGNSELVSYQQYIYNTAGGKLSNTVPVIEYDAAAGKLKKVDRLVGYEADLTVDSREKKEETASNTLYVNLNVFIIAIIPIPIPWVYGQDFNFQNRFNSVVATKVVQQYGILKEVQSASEGALTTVRNEAFDPVTGQALITSVNNEFGDKEYSVNYPAYWGYKSMGPSYVNTGYTDHFDNVAVANYEGELPTGANVANYHLGDELLVEYNYNGAHYTNNVWVTGFRQNMSGPALPECYLPNEDTIDIWDTVEVPLNYLVDQYVHPLVKPRFKYHTGWPPSGTGTLTDVSIKVIRSGAKNQLNESIQNYTAMETPFDGGGYLKDSLDKLIRISGKEFSDTLTAVLPQYDSLLNPGTFDSLNKYVNGTRQIARLSKEYAYIKNRDYSSNATRVAGLFAANTLWHTGTPVDPSTYLDSFYFCRCLIDSIGGCMGGDPPVHILFHIFGFVPNPGSALANSSLIKSYLDAQPEDDPNWVVARTVTKYSPWGYELENKDAIGNYTSAQYGYNNQLPVALAQNAQQHSVFAENFEDYQLLQVAANLALLNFAPFSAYFPNYTAVSTLYRKYNITGTGFSIKSTAAHTGLYSLLSSSTSMTLKLASQPVKPGQPEYLPFTLQNGKTYIISYWMRPSSIPANATTYSHPGNVQPKSNIIEGWQLMEGLIQAPASGTSYSLSLPSSAYLDDIRIYPSDANMKAFVYHPVSQKLVATLDENNFATFYEYDQEGNLVRTKKETEKGIITVMESRSANPGK